MNVGFFSAGLNRSSASRCSGFYKSILSLVNAPCCFSPYFDSHLPVSYPVHFVDDWCVSLSIWIESKSIIMHFGPIRFPCSADLDAEFLREVFFFFYDQRSSELMGLIPFDIQVSVPPASPLNTFALYFWPSVVVRVPFFFDSWSRRSVLWLCFPGSYSLYLRSNLLASLPVKTTSYHEALGQTFASDHLRIVYQILLPARHLPHYMNMNMNMTKNVSTEWNDNSPFLYLVV